MKISTKGRYALRMLYDLALHQEDGYVSLKDIAERQNISKKYLEQIVPLLNKTGLLRTNRGNKGGYMLAGRSGEISVGDVLRATEGSIAPVSCLEFCVSSADHSGLPCSMIYASFSSSDSSFMKSFRINPVLSIPSSVV